MDVVKDKCVYDMINIGYTCLPGSNETFFYEEYLCRDLG